MKRKFVALVKGEGKNIKDVLAGYVYACVEFGIIDAAEKVYEVDRLRHLLQEIAESES